MSNSGGRASARVCRPAVRRRGVGDEYGSRRRNTHEERRTCRRGVWYTVALYRPVYGRGEGDGRELGSTCDGVTVKRRRPVAPVYGERSKINSRVFVNSVPSVLRFAAKICFSFLPISSVMAAVAVSGIS